MTYKSKRWAVSVGGWVLGIIVSLFLVVPLIAEAFHAADPPYTLPSEVAFVCDGDSIIVTAKAEKVGDFLVAMNETPGYLLIQQQVDGLVFTSTAPLVRPDGDIVPTRPTIPVGTEFIVGPFRFEAPQSRSKALAVSVVLPGYRYVLGRIGDVVLGHKTKATIGPMMIPAC